MKFCSHCGQEIEDEAVVCPRCGEQLASGKNKKERTQKKNKGTICAVVGMLVCALLLVIVAQIVTHETPENFLNISWDLTPDEVVGIITQKLEEKRVRYFTDKMSGYTAVCMFDDPFFGFEDIAPRITVRFSGKKVTEIEFEPMKVCSSKDLKDAVERLTKMYGEPVEEREEKTFLGTNQIVVWHLEKSNVELKCMGLMGKGLMYITFTPKT